MSEPPTLNVAVVIERRKDPSPWEAWRFAVAEVTVDEGGFGTAPRLLHDDGRTRRTLFPGLPVSLFKDEGEGYFLNLTSGNPSWFVIWRVDDSDPPVARPEEVTLSYNEAGRRMESEDRVDSLPLPEPLREWLQRFADAHYRPEPKRRKRPASFQSPDRR